MHGGDVNVDNNHYAWWWFCWLTDWLWCYYFNLFPNALHDDDDDDDVMNCETLCDKLFDLFFFKIVQENWIFLIKNRRGQKICKTLKKSKALVENISFDENLETS